MSFPLRVYCLLSYSSIVYILTYPVQKECVCVFSSSCLLSLILFLYSLHPNIPCTEGVCVCVFSSSCLLSLILFLYSLHPNIPCTEGVCVSFPLHVYCLLSYSSIVYILTYPVQKECVCVFSSSCLLSLILFLYSLHPNIPCTEGVCVCVFSSSCLLSLILFLYSLHPNIPCTEGVCVCVFSSSCLLSLILFTL